MKKGLHIFVEKPLCATPEELSTLLAGQRETGVIVGVGHTELPLQSGQIDKSETVQFNQGRNHDVRSQTIHGGVQT